MNAKVNFSHGNREVTMSIGGAEKWEKATMSRTYFTLAFAGAKLPPVDKLYEVLVGGTNDDTIQVHGRTFGYQLGISCDSKTKRAAAVQAITELLTAHFAPAPELELEASEVEADDTAQRAHDIITDCADGVDGAGTELTTILHALEDGAALAALGYTDNDQPAVEYAHSAVNRLLGLGLVKLSECIELLDVCYTVDDAVTKVEECLVIDLHHFIKDTYLCGIEEVKSVDTDEDGSEVEVTRWAVLRWKTGQVNRAKTVGTFDDEDEATEAMSEARKEIAGWYSMDIYNNPDNSPFSTREAAEDVLSQASE